MTSQPCGGRDLTDAEARLVMHGLHHADFQEARLWVAHKCRYVRVIARGFFGEIMLLVGLRRSWLTSLDDRTKRVLKEMCALPNSEKRVFTNTGDMMHTGRRRRRTGPWRARSS